MVERRLFPSTNAATTRVCCSMERQFILNNMLARERKVNDIMKYFTNYVPLDDVLKMFRLY